jgi:hypothetical protein
MAANNKPIPEATYDPELASFARRVTAPNLPPRWEPPTRPKRPKPPRAKRRLDVPTLSLVLSLPLGLVATGIAGPVARPAGAPIAVPSSSRAT